MRGAVLRAWRAIEEMPALYQDSFLYLASALFAVLTAAVALSADYRAWGQMAAVAYGAGALICAIAGWYASHRLSASMVALTRRLVVLLVLIGAVLVPLVAEITWRAEARPGSHAQAEVATIERAGDRAAASKSPYLLNPTTVGVSPSSDAKSIDANSYFPYLPGMIPFGMVNAFSGPPELTDARVALVGFTLIVAAIALCSSDATVSRRGRALQFLVVLPSGALPMVTGGDDLPVLALLLLGLVLATKRHPMLAGLATGLAGTLKFTAWPVLLVLGLVVRDQQGARAPLRYGIAVAASVVPAVLVGVLSRPVAFVKNVIGFPLGLTKVKSPAASPLLGHFLTDLFPDERRLVTFVLALIGVGIVVYVFARWRPTTPAGVARFVAIALTVATFLAPATRFGYLIYPTNLIVWAYVLDGMGQSASSTSKTRSSTELEEGEFGVPASAGLIDGVTGSTMIPTSQ